MTPRFRDDFSKNDLAQKWYLGQIHESQYRYGDGPDGGRALVISLSTGDDGAACNVEVPCQRAEIRLAKDCRPAHGDEIWQSYAFRIVGAVPDTGSVRTVIGEWKAPFDDSPCIAQRFDDGIFHITAQDDVERANILFDNGTRADIVEFETALAAIGNHPGLGPPAMHIAHSLAELKDHAGITFDNLNDPAWTEFRVMLDKAVAAARGVNGGRLGELFDKFYFLRSPMEVVKRTSIRVEAADTARLRSPDNDWVRMMYRIKLGRTDNEYGPKHEGEVDIYMDGDLVAKVRGNIGNRLRFEEHAHLPEFGPMYFKFGLYRDVLPGTVEVHLADYRQGPAMADIFPTA